MHMLQCYIHVYAYINMNIEQIPSKSFREDYHSQKGNERERAVNRDVEPNHHTDGKTV